MRNWIIAITLVILSAPTHGQTNVVYFTNRVATFTNLQGRVYDRVELVRMDAFTIVYRDQSGGGRIYITNLSPITLASLGMSTNLAAEATKLDRELAEQKAASEAEERARMADPKNWREVRVVAVHRWWDDRLECQIAEMSKRVLLRRPPADMVAYFSKRSELAGAIQYAESERLKLMNKASQLDFQIKTYDAQIKQRQYHVDIADANTPTGVESDVYTVNVIMARRAEINRAQINLQKERERLVEAQDELKAMLDQIPLLKERAEQITTQLQALDRESSKAATVRVFITSRRYYDFPILECAAK